MSQIKVEDGAGSSVSLYEIDGYRVPRFQFEPEEITTLIRNMKDFKCRDDDVFICAPVKSGTHWTWEIVSMLLQGQAETVPIPKIDQMVEAQMPNTFDAIPSPRVLNSHVSFHKLPTDIKEKGCKVIFVLRNLKDMAVSYWHHCKGVKLYDYDGDFEHFLPLVLNGKLDYNDWFDYLLEWERVMEEHPDIPILVLYYEDMKTDLQRETKRIASFLGVDDLSLVANVAKKCSFKNMAVDKKETEVKMRSILQDGFSFYRKGEVGEWKNHFTVAQNEMFDSFYNNKMKSLKLKFKFSYE